MERNQIPLLSLADSCRIFAESEGVNAEDHGDFVIYRSSSFLYGRTVIFHSDDLQKTISKIKNAGPTPVCCFTREVMQNDYNEIMLKEGYAPLVVQTGMIFDLDKPFDKCKDENIVVLSPEEAGINADIFEKALGGVPQERNVSEAYAKLGSGKGNVYAYKADGEYVASAIALFSEGCSGIHQVGTLEKARRKGYARKLLLRCLEDAKNAGMDQISLQASDLGKLTYETIGFETVSLISSYILPPK